MSLTTSLSSLSPRRFDFLLWCLCGACHTPTPQQRRLLLASSSVSSVSKSSRAATLPVPALTPARSPAPLTWWRWPSPRPSRLTCRRATAPTAASTAGHTWPITTSSSQRYEFTTQPVLPVLHLSCPAALHMTVNWSVCVYIHEKGYRVLCSYVTNLPGAMFGSGWRSAGEK